MIPGVLGLEIDDLGEALLSPFGVTRHEIEKGALGGEADRLVEVLGGVLTVSFMHPALIAFVPGDGVGPIEVNRLVQVRLASVLAVPGPCHPTIEISQWQLGIELDGLVAVGDDQVEPLTLQSEGAARR